MTFEFDPQKSASNKIKHGIDFRDAQKLWSGAPREYPLGVTNEMRYLVVGKIDGQHWTAVVTYRGGTIRLISVRQSGSPEIQRYEQDAKKR